ncbi:WhiB family transcriptional regulator [Microbacterium sp. NPDC077663]|uniref:WhiB family transcriptional regulator n=1 Tax=Microbacterium sp. NPDC077663 TaxID=3364189 RepID=UPI0037C8CD0D
MAARPACAGDPRFTADFLSAAAVAQLARICAQCPVRQACAAYADTLSPYTASGVWAGRRRGVVQRADYRPRKEAS